MNNLIIKFISKRKIKFIFLFFLFFLTNLPSAFAAYECCTLFSSNNDVQCIDLNENTETDALKTCTTAWDKNLKAQGFYQPDIDSVSETKCTNTKGCPNYTGASPVPSSPPVPALPTKLPGEHCCILNYYRCSGSFSCGNAVENTLCENWNFNTCDLHFATDKLQTYAVGNKTYPAKITSKPGDCNTIKECPQYKDPTIQQKLTKGQCCYTSNNNQFIGCTQFGDLGQGEVTEAKCKTELARTKDNAQLLKLVSNCSDECLCVSEDEWFDPTNKTASKYPLSTNINKCCKGLTEVKDNTKIYCRKQGASGVPIEAIKIKTQLDYPGLGLGSVTKSGNIITVEWLSYFIIWIYKYSVGIAAIMATVLIMIGGLQYILAAGESGKVTKAKETIQAALTGLIIIIGAYFILNFIDPKLTTIKPITFKTQDITVPKQTASSSPNITAAAAPAADGTYPGEKVPTTPLTKHENIIIHHSKSSGKFAAYEYIRKWHAANKGFGNYIAYHYYITPDGKIYKGREDNIQGVHVKGGTWNYKSLGICLGGNFMIEKPTEAQIKSLKSLVNKLRLQFNIPKENIFGHKEVGQKGHTLCPGDNMMPIVKEMRK